MREKIEFILNDSNISIEVDPNLSLLRLMRDVLGIRSVKLACGEGECGACTVILGDLKNSEMRYRNVASCILPVGSVTGKHVVTVEGINGEELSPVQRSLIDEGAIQCGYCIPGFVVSLTSFFMTGRERKEEEIIDSIDGNICRCTGYFPIRRAAEKLYSEYSYCCGHIDKLVEKCILPSYFLNIPEMLRKIDDKKIRTDSSEKRVIVSGGTDLYVGEYEKSSRRLFLDLYTSDELISEDNGEITIPATATTEEIKRSRIMKKCFPDIDKYFNLISSEIIRNRATLGGNIANASPIGDLSVLFLALDSILLIKGPDSERKLPLKAFFKEYKKIDLQENEMIVSLSFIRPGSNDFFNFEKVSRRTHLDIASCNSAMKISMENNVITGLCLSAGGVAPVPLVIPEASSITAGKKINRQTISDILEVVDKNISPISDIRGSKEYKRALIRRLVIAHFSVLFPKEIEYERFL